MKLKTFRGKTMAEVLREVKRHFGPDAVILNTRTLTRGGLLGLGEKPYVEITAARQLADLPEPLRRDTLLPRTDRRVRPEGAGTPVSAPRPTTAALPPEAVLSELSTLRTLVTDLVRETRRSHTGSLPDALYETYQKLVERAVAEEIARWLVDSLRQELTAEQLHDARIVRAHLARAMESMLPTSGPVRPVRTDGPTVIALIGPTGVGKTTTIAKLAANLCLREHRKVGLITIDTYRIAAVEQLRTYAQIIDVPLEVVVSPTELKRAVLGMQDREIVLIDTAGRSQRDHHKIGELRTFFDAVKPDEVHLVLSGACSEAVLQETIRRFQPVGIDRILFTKLDETVGFGVILGCLSKAEARLSYVTTGQDVPEDIQVGEGRALAQLILGRNRREDKPG
jgi:flagellar biosynthesis protein FlhF